MYCCSKINKEISDESPMTSAMTPCGDWLISTPD